MKGFLFIILSVFSTLIVHGQTFTTVQDGDWSQASTWDANGVPPVNLSNDIVNINHRIEVSNTIKFQGNTTMNVNHILRLNSGSIEIEETTDILNINYGLIITVNGNVLNKKGTVNFNYGRIQMCNDGYKDESSSPQGTFGIGTIFSENGNIEDSNSGNFSSNIEWCTVDGNGVNMPNVENCYLVDPPGADCDDEVTYLNVICHLTNPTDTDGDRIVDLCDLDDDNDGITDVDELDGDANRDTDSDGLINSIDIDSDNDGIPDNVEAQLTLGYIAPSGTVDNTNGILLVYGVGLAPVDSDRDGISDIVDLDSDNDGLPDIQENGMADNIITFSDNDGDGLDLLFEGSNINDPTDVNDEINSPEASILPDADGDLYSGGDLDYRDLFDTNPPLSALLDFDGVDDYLSGQTVLEGEGRFTLMVWVNSDAANAGDYPHVVSEGFSARLYLLGGNRPTFAFRTTTVPGSDTYLSGTAIPYGEWHHITATFDNTTGELKIYIDGELNKTKSTGNNGIIQQTAEDLGTFDIGRFATDVANKRYFKGQIDEVRLFDTVLTEDQIQRMVYQEIEENSSNVIGKVIKKDIEDMNTNVKVPWNELIAYYPMTDIVNNKTSDFSSNNKTLYLNNITTIQEQTAPMPYISQNNGDWSNTATWKYGNVWDIEDETNNKDWSIVHIASNVTTSNSHKQLGMIVNDGNTLTVNGDKKLENTWYLELNGAIDLQGDSQLIQTGNSDLVTGGSGKISRRQKGTSNVYWYTYMASPVGVQQATSLTDNNSSSNNANNTAFSLNMLKEGNGSAVEFTSAYDEVGKMSTRWTYTFLNGITYWDWAPLVPATGIASGVGYIHKGLGNPGLTQEYIFEGKPNNGTILVAADDVNGDSGNESQPDVTQTTTLIGNPYPSAIDAHQFIDDNAGVIDGTLYFWHQWAGSTHILDEYEGGYAVVNKMAKIRAYQFVGMSGADNGSQDGAITPTQFIPVGQSFMAEVIADGNIEFNNAQRVFKREAQNETEFFRGSERTSEEGDSLSVQVIRLEFGTSKVSSREIAIGFSGFTSTEAFDYGYDGKMFDPKSEDMYTYLSGNKMIAQAYSALTHQTVVPLAVNTTGHYKYSIKATGFENFNKDTGVYLRDKYESLYFDLRSGKAYGFTSGEGEFTDRFEIVFKTNKQVEQNRSGRVTIANGLSVFYDRASDKLFVKGLASDADQLVVYNTGGQVVGRFRNPTKTSLERGLSLSGLSPGVYIVGLTENDGQRTDKKLLID